jgi:hypothetical protein
LHYRTFAPDLSPTSDDLVLAATTAAEDHVVLAAFNGQWAAAWRSGQGGFETIEVQSGASHWSVGPFLPGASDDHPALTFVDGNHLALAFSEGFDAFGSGIASVPRLHAAVLDTAYPGHAESFEVRPLVEPYASLLNLGQSQPAVVSYGDRLVVAWRSSSALGDPAGDELWSREIKWTSGPSNTLLIDTSSPEKLLLTGGDLRAGNQSRLNLLTSKNWPDHRLLSVWQEDSHRVQQNSSGLPDVLVQFAQVPGELPSLVTGPCNAITFSISPPNGPAVDSASVTLTAAATCGPGSEPEYQFAYQNPGSTSWALIRGWGSAVANWNTAGLPSGSYAVYAYARRKGSSVGFDSNAGLGYLVGSVCYKNPTFTVTPSGVQAIGTQLTLSASATCSGNGTVPEHRSYYWLPGSSTWLNIGTWSTSPVNWDTSGLPSGAYTLVTYVRGQGNASGFESYVYGGALLGNVCYSVNSVTPSPASPQGIGVTVALSATATCVGSTAPEFRYFYYPPGSGTPTPIGTWSTSPVNFATAGLTPGNYGFLAYVRGVGNNSDKEASGNALGAYKLGSTCPSVNISAAPSAPQPIGSIVTLTASAGCNAEYQFSYRLWGTSLWHMFRDWSSSASTAWDTTGLASGNYEALASARIAGHVAQETYTEMSYLLGDVCQNPAISAAPSSPRPSGTTLALSATSSCTNGASAEYQFYYRAANATALTLIRDWGPATFNWSTSAISPGNYMIFVYARAHGNTDMYDSVGFLGSYVLQ